MMGFYWVTASFFLILPFYLFKAPVYCTTIQGEDTPCVGTSLLIRNALTPANSSSACPPPRLFASLSSKKKL